jgi:hypothetical protein
MTLFVEPTNVLAQVVFGGVCSADPGRARRDQPPPADGLVALEIGA